MNRLDRLLMLRDAEPADPEIHYMIAIERAKEGDTAQAVAGFDECLRLDPAFSYAYYHKAVTLEGVGRRDEARSAVAEGIEQAQAGEDPKALSELETLLESFS